MTPLGLGIARVEVNVTDNSSLPNYADKGVIAVVGITQKGEERKPRLIKSWAEFQRFYGGLVSYSDFPLYCKIALDAGAILFVSRAAHYSDIDDPTTFDGLRAYDSDTWGSSPNAGGVFVEAASFGEWANDYVFKINLPASQLAGTVDLIVQDANGNVVTYVADFTDSPVQEDIDYFNQLSTSVKIISWSGNFTGISQSLVTERELTLSNGFADYSAFVETDFLGSTIGGTGIRAFDNYSGFSKIALFEGAGDLVAIHDSFISYVEERKDCLAVLPVPTSLDGYQAVDFRLRQGVWTPVTFDPPNTWRAMLIFGDIQVKDPRTNLLKYVSAVADVAALMSVKDQKGNAWDSFSGDTRGIIKGKTGLLFNLGTNAKLDEANAVDIAGINLVIQDAQGNIKSWGNSTLSRANSLLKHANVAELVIFLVNSLKPLVQSNLFDPNDPITWKSIYRKVSAFMDNVKSNRGVYDYQYDGDQTADKVTDAVYNTQGDIAAGIYRFKLSVQPTPALKYIGIEIAVTNAGVSVSIV